MPISIHMGSGDAAAPRIFLLPLEQESPMLKSSSRFDSPLSGRYLVQLCKHFGHKVPVALNEDQGTATVDFIRDGLLLGRCHMAADAQSLTMDIEAATPGGRDEVQAIVGGHLVRFAWKEEPSDLSWTTLEETHP